MIKGVIKSEFIEKFILSVIIIFFIVADPKNKLLLYSSLVPLSLLFIISLKRKINFTLIPLLLLLCWLYGVIIGLLNGNDNVFRNNIGIIFFTFYYYFINTSVSKKYLFYLIYYSSIFAVIYCIFIIKDMEIIDLILEDNRIIYTISILFPFSIYPYLYGKIVSKIYFQDVSTPKLVDYLLFIILNIFALIFVKSKGIYLFILFVIMIYSIHNLRSFIFIILVLILISLFFLNFFKAFTIFGLEDPGNIERFSQIEAVFDELTWFGKGWGGLFESQALQRDAAGYSIEISYFNLIHKIGLFSIFFFYYYMNYFFRVFKLKSTDFSRAIAIGVIFYLFVALGNPNLFAIQFIFLHLIGESIVYKNQLK
tara:strand:+ start:23238 stop:24338 length:1101 start_codon:yes stop_codon:yes gene_type:complete